MKTSQKPLQIPQPSPELQNICMLNIWHIQYLDISCLETHLGMWRLAPLHKTYIESVGYLLKCDFKSHNLIVSETKPKFHQKFQNL